MSVPNGWLTAPLGSIAHLVMGQSPDSKFYTEEERGLPFLQGCAEFGAKHPVHQIYCSQIRKVAHQGAILFSVRAPVARLNVADKQYIIGRGLAAIQGKDIDQNYLEQYLKFQESLFQTASQGSTFEAINTSELSKWVITFPSSLTEQSKIADILSTVDRSIEQTEALISKQQRIKTGLMQDLLTKGIDENGNLRSEETHEFKDSPMGRIPVEWDCSQLSHYVPSAEYGISSSLGDSGYPVLRMNNISNGESDISDLKYSNFNIPNKLFLKNGDVLFNRTNSWEHVGRTGIWRNQIEKSTFASYLVRLNPDKSLLRNELLNIWLNWESVQISMRRYATPGVQQVNINPTNLRSLYSAFPSSLAEQDEIVKRYNDLNDALIHSNRSLAKLRSLKTALMQDLLTGKVRVTPLLHGGEVGA